MIWRATCRRGPSDRAEGGDVMRRGRTAGQEAPTDEGRRAREHSAGATQAGVNTTEQAVLREGLPAPEAECGSAALNTQGAKAESADRHSRLWFQPCAAQQRPRNHAYLRCWSPRPCMHAPVHPTRACQHPVSPFPPCASSLPPCSLLRDLASDLGHAGRSACVLCHVAPIHGDHAQPRARRHRLETVPRHSPRHLLPPCTRAASVLRCDPATLRPPSQLQSVLTIWTASTRRAAVLILSAEVLTTCLRHFP